MSVSKLACDLVGILITEILQALPSGETLGATLGKPTASPMANSVIIRVGYQEIYVEDHETVYWSQGDYFREVNLATSRSRAAFVRRVCALHERSGGE